MLVHGKKGPQTGIHDRQTGRHRRSAAETRLIRLSQVRGLSLPHEKALIDRTLTCHRTHTRGNFKFQLQTQNACPGTDIRYTASCSSSALGTLFYYRLTASLSTFEESNRQGTPQTKTSILSLRRPSRAKS